MNESPKTAQQNNEIVLGLTKANQDLVIRMIESGVDEKDIPYILGVDKRHSIASWENQDPKVRHLFNKAREVLLNKVENSLLRVALGGTLVTVKDSEKNGIETITKEIGPNPVVCEKLLKLFRPDPWLGLEEADEKEKPMTPQEMGIEEVKRMREIGGKFFEELLNRRVVISEVVNS